MRFSSNLALLVVSLSPNLGLVAACARPPASPTDTAASAPAPIATNAAPVHSSATATTTAPPIASDAATTGTDGPDVARARENALAQLFTWENLDKATFERARREHRFILLHCAAAWCHFCHVMEEVTYRNPEVGKLLRDRFIAVKVDIDARPDIEARYGDWGWPATIVFSPEGDEIGKMRGFIPPDAMLETLTAVDRAARIETSNDGEPGATSAPVDALPWLLARSTRDLRSYYDANLGGWGMRQKTPFGENIEYEVRASRTDPDALERALFSIAAQRTLIDPVWGGIYQYSVGGTWAKPHFEKLMTMQAANLDAYASAYEKTKRADVLADAHDIVRYVDRFLTSPDGAFYTNQDADVGAHDEHARFVTGHAYYAMDEKGRLAAGQPWIDTHVYAYENGLMIAALVDLARTAGDDAALAHARRAGDALLATHVDPAGAVAHDPQNDYVRFLADAASLGRACAMLYQATHDAHYRDAALHIEARMVETLLDPATGAFFEHTVDPDAEGAFQRRQHPFRPNVLAARFLAALESISGKKTYGDIGRRALAAISTPVALEDQGRILGSYLLALDELGAAPAATKVPTSKSTPAPKPPPTKPEAKPASATK